MASRTILTLALIALTASAAPAWAGDDDDDDGRRGRGKGRGNAHGKDGKEGRDDDRRRGGVDRDELDEIIDRAARAADELADEIDDDLDGSRWNGTRREDEINAELDDLDRALESLRRGFDEDDDDADDWTEDRREARLVLGEAQDVERIMAWGIWGEDAREDWRDLRSELQRIRRIFALNPPPR